MDDYDNSDQAGLLLIILRESIVCSFFLGLAYSPEKTWPPQFRFSLAPPLRWAYSCQCRLTVITLCKLLSPMCLQDCQCRSERESATYLAKDLLEVMQRRETTFHVLYRPKLLCQTLTHFCIIFMLVWLATLSGKLK